MKINLVSLRKTIITLTFCLLSGGAGYFLGTHNISLKQGEFAIGQKSLPVQRLEVVNKTVPADKDLDFTLFWQVWNRVNEKFLEKEKLDQQKMFYGAIQGLTLPLDDPYTVFLPPKDNKQAQEDLNGSFEGVGIRLGFSKENQLSIIAPLKGSPAQAAGARSGDLILHLKDENKGIDEDTINITLPEAVEKIRGPKGSKIYITVLHEEATETKELEIIRDTIVVPSVEVEFLNEDGEKVDSSEAGFAHLQLMRFGELTDEQWDKSIDRIIAEEAHLKGVILDVRGNPGGYLKGSINLASEFLSNGVIVKQENYLGEVDTYSVNRRGRLLNTPLAVLIDKGSASASEILAGALQDHDRAQLIGVNSFGKGTIQETEEFPGGAGLHITTDKWLTPNGNWINKTGLTPDMEVKNDPENPDDDKQLKQAVKYLLEN
jgi:carboxyl-terminal processing protease